MRLPKDLLSGTYRKPNVYLCEADKEKICKLETSNMQASLKFNSYSELSFEVARIYNDIITGEQKVNPFYEKIEAVRLIYLEGFGYFEIQGPELIGDGIKESKSITAYSLEYTLSQKYLEDFYINTGEVNSVEVIYAEVTYGKVIYEGDSKNIIPVTLYNPNNTSLSLLHLILEKVPGWTIGHVDSQLKTLSRQFEVDRESIYDFLMNEVCKKFNCYITFDTINNKINVYAESPTVDFRGDGSTKILVIPSAYKFSAVQTVSIDGYKTTGWSFTGSAVILDEAPGEGAVIEVVGEDSSWETDVFVTFDNLSQEIKVNYSADDIKTVLTVTYGDDCDIREVNLGLPYITDLSYFYTVDWMGQDLYDAYTAYQKKYNDSQPEYTQNAHEMLYYAGLIDHEENRLSLGYAEASVDETTVGTYYVRGGKNPNYYYTEVSLPSEYNANTTYYRTDTVNVTEDKVSKLFKALQKYFNKSEDWYSSFTELSDEFHFMSTYGYTIEGLASKLKASNTDAEKDGFINEFLHQMWYEIGKNPLNQMFYEPYKQIQTANVAAGWANKNDSTNENYWTYYPVVIFLDSIEKAIAERDKKIKEYQSKYDIFQQANIKISNSLLMDNNFTKEQLVKLNAFLREDELHIEDIVETAQDSVADTFKVKQDAKEAGRIELKKISQPQLQFSMSMANIYAIPEFEPIVDQFQLGNIIKVGLRSDYIKQSRLMQVNINFEDFSDFSCEFGELTSLRNQSDIHADLLSQAISAGKSVATNSSYWSRGSDTANSIDLRLQEGLLNSIEALKSMDGTQNAYMDKYGLHLEAVNPETGEVDDKRVWLVNNQIVFTDDGFKTSKSVLGEFTVDGVTYYGLLAQAVIAGLVEGSEIRGGTIKIGEYIDENGNTRYAFEVTENGMVRMHAAGNMIDGYATIEDVDKVQTIVDDINNSKMYRVEIVSDSSTAFSSDKDKATLTCRVYSWDTDITDLLDASDFNWKRTSSNAEQDIIWNAMPEHQGKKSITIYANPEKNTSKIDDVEEKASFTCEVNLPGIEE